MPIADERLGFRNGLFEKLQTLEAQSADSLIE